MRFAEVLNDLMIDKDITIKELAELTKINLSTLYKYFKHDTIPDLERAIILSDFFNCSINFLLGLSDKKEIKIEITGKSFVENYKYLLKEFKTNNYNVCKELNIDWNSIYKWNKGKTPKMKILIEFAKYFGTSVEFLVGRTKNY
ncbi:MAG: helix-turn-helix domain-containing protein [Candidatus Caccovivens sp.]